MCAIAGIVSKKEINEFRDTEIVRNMLRKLAHRGPDDEGMFIGKNFVFGHKKTLNNRCEIRKTTYGDRRRKSCHNL